MQVQLIVTNKSQNGQTIPVNVPAFRIGQAEDCHLRSKSSQISPQHCVIYTHDGSVTIQDLGGETGTYVNGKRIVSQQELKEGDTLVVGRHSFVLSIKTGAPQPAAGPSDSVILPLDPSHTDVESEPVAEEVMFEVRHKGQSVSVTKKRLFEMARKGTVLPDDVITVAGTKVFADSVQGIVFGNESSDTAPLPYTATAASDSTYAPAQSYEMEKNATAAPAFHGSAGPPDVSAFAGESSPFDIADEPRAHVDRVPGARKEVTFSDLGKSLEEPLSQASTWMDNNVTKQRVAIAGSVLVALCLLGGLVYLLIPEAKSLYGAVRIVGTLTVDGKPVADAAVNLYPRNTNGREADGRTDSRGRFLVTTGADPFGRGAVEGEYDVAFFKRGEIPSIYESPKTSGQSIKVERSGKKTFEFNLTSGDSPLPPQVTNPGTSTSTTSTLTSPVAKPTPGPGPIREPDFSSPRPSYQSTLRDIWAAAERGTAQDIEFFVRRDRVLANAKDSVSGDTLLHRAAQNNPNVDVLRFLVAQGAGVNAANNAGNTPLFNAAASNANVDVLIFLVSNDANVNAGNNEGNTPLHVAARNNSNAEILKYLARRANVSARNNDNHTPLDVTRVDTKRQILIDAGATSSSHGSPSDLPAPQPQPHTFSDIFDAVAMGTTSEVQTLLSKEGVRIDVTDDLGRTPLHNAARFNSEAGVVNLLITRGANVNARCEADWTPLHEAARSNPNAAVLQLLVERGRAAVDLVHVECKQTPLHCAATSNTSVAVLSYLVRRGASINLRDANGDTPLHLAARLNPSEEVLQVLVSQPSIEINAKNRHGETPLDSAYTDGKKRILIDAGGKSGRGQ